MNIGIYKITNPNGKIYIGGSINIKRRLDEYIKLKKCKNQYKLFNSLKKYGVENHKFEIIEECDLFSLNEKELYWSLYYNVLGENGLNLKIGNHRGKCSEETKQKISKANLGKKRPKTPEHKQKIGKQNSKTIYQYDLQGNLIREWSSIKEAELKFNKSIKDNLKNKLKTASGYIWSYGKFPGYNNVHKNSFSVYQYDLQGNLIREWSSTMDIQRTLGFANSNISNCCLKKQKTAYGFKWEYKKS